MSYTTFQADLDREKDSILRFWRENHPRPLEGKYRWLYEGNPAGKAKVWIIKHVESGDLVGMTALFPRVFHRNDKSLVGGVAGDFLVHKNHRTMGPAIMLQRCVLSSADRGEVDFVYGFPNRSAEAISKRIGYKRLGGLTRLVKILKSEPQLRKRGVKSALVPFAGPMADAFLKLGSLETWYRWTNGYVCEEVNALDDRLAPEREGHNGSFTMMGLRSANFLNWKFKDDPEDDNRIFVCRNRENSTVAGYIVFRLQDDSVDVRDFGLPVNRPVYFTLMASFLRHARSLGTEKVVVNALENETLTKKLRPFGFMEGESDRNVYIYRPDRAGSADPVPEDPDSWLLMQCDEDT